MKFLVSFEVLNLKADSSVPDSYNNDYVAIGAVSSDITVYAILGNSNQVNIANYYYLNDNKLTLVSKDSYPAECSTLESQKVGQGMRCTDGAPNYTQRTVNYTGAASNNGQGIATNTAIGVIKKIY